MFLTERAHLVFVGSADGSLAYLPTIVALFDLTLMTRSETHTHVRTHRVHCSALSHPYGTLDSSGVVADRDTLILPAAVGRTTHKQTFEADIDTAESLAPVSYCWWHVHDKIRPI